MKLIITEPSHFSEKALALLNLHFEVIQLSRLKDLSIHIHEATILFIRLGIHFNASLLQKAKKMKVICTPTTGLDHIDTDFCNKQNIKIISLKGEVDFLGTIPSTAEHTFTLLNAVNRYLNLANHSINEKIWDRNQFKSYNLYGKTLGILGIGRVGKQVANYAHAFGMNVIAYDFIPEIKHPNVTVVKEVQDLFKKSDFLSIHIPLEYENIKFVSKDLIKLMKPTACIINTSRGKVWDEQAIVDALMSHKLRGVATDVVYNEVDEEVFASPIFSIDTHKYNCIITPHIAGATYDSMKMTEEFITAKLLRLFNE